MVQWFIRLITHGGPTELILVPANSHKWCNKGHGIYSPVTGKE